MMYYLNLHPAPFASIKAGEKVVEMRLYDEKRRLIKSGDKITFTNNQSGETLVCLVEDIKVFNSFESLYLAYDKTKLGYKTYETANPEDMKIYYPLASMQEQGVCAIEIKLI